LIEGATVRPRRRRVTRANDARWDERAEVVPGTVNVSHFDGMQAGSEWGEDVLRDCGGYFG